MPLVGELLRSVATGLVEHIGYKPELRNTPSPNKACESARLIFTRDDGMLSDVSEMTIFDLGDAGLLDTLVMEQFASGVRFNV